MLIALKRRARGLSITSLGDGIRVSRSDFSAFCHGETHLGKHESPTQAPADEHHRFIAVFPFCKAPLHPRPALGGLPVSFAARTLVAGAVAGMSRGGVAGPFLGDGGFVSP